MKKLYAIAGTAALAGTLFFGAAQASEILNIPNPPSVPVEEKITFPANQDKVLKDAETFLNSIDSLHKSADAIPVIRERILYKDIRNVYPEIKDRMNWVAPDRQVYILVSNFNEYKSRDGVWANAQVYTLFDAETGENLGGGVIGEPPAGFGPPSKR
jgi:hypothetical protein